MTVCLCVGHTYELWTSWHAIWGRHSYVPKKQCVRLGYLWAPRDNLWLNNICMMVILAIASCYYYWSNLFVIIADPTFDLLPSVKDCQPATFHSSVVLAKSAVCQNTGQSHVFNVSTSCERTSSKKFDEDIGRLMSSPEWLKIYGLKAAKLDMNYLLRQIAFRHSDGKHSCFLD